MRPNRKRGLRRAFDILLSVHRFVLLVLLGAAGVAGLAPQPELLDILAGELQRNFEVMRQKGDPPPYYIAYTVTEEESAAVSASQGTLQSSSADHRRILDVTVRTGSPELDNYHRLPGERPRFHAPVSISLDNNPASIRQRLWLQTDQVYRAAAERLIRVKTSRQVKVAEEDLSADFSKEEPVIAADPAMPLRFPMEGWRSRARSISKLFTAHPQILESQVVVQAKRQTKYFVNTEGTRLRHGRLFSRITIAAGTKAADGMDLTLFESFDAAEPAGLPDEGELSKAVHRIAKKLERLSAAPLVEPFVGPAILSGRASGVFFHEIFGHRIEGHRQKDEGEGQTFTKKVGQEILPDFLSVEFDPTKKTTSGVDLNGFYSFDDEGVKARPVAVVEKGVLKTFLMSRTPIEGFSTSNGHGRKAPGAEVVSRQSNLFVHSLRRFPQKQLRTMLIDEIKKQGKPYGLYFEEVTGGFTMTGRRGLQAFTVIPVIVYRVYADGRPDEMVRGVDIVGTPLTSFAKVLATSNEVEVFNGYCGAESGNVPVSAVSPALLISEIEIQKKDKSDQRPPLLPRPVVLGGGR